jgi:hypothetical protein
MATTPFIKALPVAGGAFYTFSSSAEDLSLTFNNSGAKFSFSKFALLNLPNIAVPAFNDNKIQFAAIDGAFTNGIVADNNINLAQSFQNYALNLESMIISRKDTSTTEGYDREQKQNTAERVFWKWVKELGAIRFKQANPLETNVAQPGRRFLEEADNKTGDLRYQRVVQYVGDITIVNSAQNNDNAYSEIYIHVPTDDGNTPLVLFKSVEDVNYKPGMVIKNTPDDPLNIEVLYGRKYNDTHPAGLSINAFYDQDSIGEPVSMLYNNISGDFDISMNWYDPAVGPNSYFTESSFNDPTTDTYQKSIGLTTITYKRSRLDGIMLDFDPDNYKPITDDPSISTIQEFNSTGMAAPFEFNVVLVYYDVYESDNTENKATNLYGVLFLEDVEQIGTEYGIPRFKKFKPDPVTKLNGNSFGFKINVKFDTSIDNVGTEKAINNYNNFSMELFMDTMNILQDATKNINDQTYEIIEMKKMIMDLEDRILNMDDINEITARLSFLEKNIEINQALFANTNDIMKLINKNRDEIRLLLQGRTSIEVSYNIDAIKQGTGVTIDKSVPNQIRIHNANQSFNVGNTYQTDLSLNATVPLRPYTNYFRHNAGGTVIQAQSNVTMFIDDSENGWKRGQTFRLVFKDPLDLGTTYSFDIYTDANDEMGMGEYGVLIGSISSAEFNAANDMPIFDITCVDSENMLFVIDQVR